MERALHLLPELTRGRGVSENLPNRFEKLHYEADPDLQIDSGEAPAPKTEYFGDPSRSILSYNNSPDVGFEVSINPYRGCEHGCSYCYARPFHEYLGFSAGLDFETKILVKEDAPKLLQKELSAPNWRPQAIAMSGVTDPYQPIERRLKITRQCLEVLAEFRNPVVIITKNFFVTRDVDLLAELARHHAVAVFLSITTLDEELRRAMEPRTSSPPRRIEAIEKLSQAGVPVGVMTAPVIPGLNDHEIPAIITAAARAGARHASYTLVRLPHAVAPLFEKWLDQHRPERKEKVLNRIREIRGGRLNDSHFGSRMEGEGIFARQIDSLFEISCHRVGIENGGPRLSVAAFRYSGGVQIPLF
ncbi:MAG: PA0069 family radical SAM protein [Deltaproteobacteria bacterium]|nr:PA0069 family radical SAM protein [Deltaproteobacteria bacterium]